MFGPDFRYSKSPQAAVSLQSPCLGFQSIFLPEASTGRPRWAPLCEGLWSLGEPEEEALQIGFATPPTQPLDGFTQKEVLQGQTQYLHEMEV